MTKTSKVKKVKSKSPFKRRQSKRLKAWLGTTSFLFQNLPKYNRARGWCQCIASRITLLHFCRFVIEPTASQKDAEEQYIYLHNVNYPEHDLIGLSGFQAFIK